MASVKDGLLPLHTTEQKTVRTVPVPPSTREEHRPSERPAHPDDSINQRIAGLRRKGTPNSIR